MSKPIRFRFSKRVVYTGQIAIATAFLVFTFYLVLGLPERAPIKDLWILILLYIFHACFLYWHSKYYFLPTIHKNFALELNDNEIIIYADSIVIDWNQIVGFQYINYGLAKAIVVDIYNKKEIVFQKVSILQKIFSSSSFYRYRSIVIQTLFVKGKTKDIFKTMTNYLEQKQNCT